MKDEEIINEDIKLDTENQEAKSIEDGSPDTSDEVFRDDVVFVDSTEDGDTLPTKDIVKKLKGFVQSFMLLCYVIPRCFQGYSVCLLYQFVL